MRAAHPAVLHVDVPRIPGNLATDGNAAVSVLHGAVANDQVLRWNTYAAAVAIAAGLDGDAIVSGIEFATLNQNVGAALRIATVVVGPMAIDPYVPHSD